MPVARYCASAQTVVLDSRSFAGQHVTAVRLLSAEEVVAAYLSALADTLIQEVDTSGSSAALHSTSEA